jgi:hypothetical protein
MVNGQKVNTQCSSAISHLLKSFDQKLVVRGTAVHPGLYFTDITIGKFGTAFWHLGISLGMGSNTNQFAVVRYDTYIVVAIERNTPGHDTVSVAFVTIGLKQGLNIGRIFYVCRVAGYYISLVKRFFVLPGTGNKYRSTDKKYE